MLIFQVSPEQRQKPLQKMAEKPDLHGKSLDLSKIVPKKTNTFEP